MASAGIGRIVDVAARDANGQPAPITEGASPAFFVVVTARATACVPFERAPETLRPLVPEPVARQMLEVLRGASPALADSMPLLERGRRVVHSGDPLPHARLLRELCGLPAPLSEALASGLRFVAALTLPELERVLALPSGSLRRELRARFPAFASAAEDATPSPDSG